MQDTFFGGSDEVATKNVLPKLTSVLEQKPNENGNQTEPSATKSTTYATRRKPRAGRCFK